MGEVEQLALLTQPLLRALALGDVDDGQEHQLAVVDIADQAARIEHQRARSHARECDLDCLALDGDAALDRGAQLVGQTLHLPFASAELEKQAILGFFRHRVEHLAIRAIHAPHAKVAIEQYQRRTRRVDNRLRIVARLAQLHVDLAHFQVAVAQLLVGGRQLFIGRLQLLLCGLQLFVRALKLFVGGKGFLVRRAQLFLRCLVGLDDGGEVAAGRFELASELLDVGAVAHDLQFAA